MTGLLEVASLTHRFGSVTVADDLSFDVADGEALGIVGPNGAGKTTVLNLVAGDLRPRRGEIRFDGDDVTTLPSNARCRRGIGRTAQIPRPFLGLTAFENVLVGATFGIAKRSRAARRDEMAVEVAVEALAHTHLLPKANVPTSELTLLERKRLELARALATRPRLLLLDEIAGGLTDDEVEVLIDTIKQIRAAGVTIVWIEHVVHALLSVVDRIMAINFGRLLIIGDPHEVMSSSEVRDIYLGEDDSPPDDRADSPPDDRADSPPDDRADSPPGDRDGS